MRILFVHNAYQHRGGEESVVEAEVALLRRNGHDVSVYRRDNRDVEHIGSLHLFADTVWSQRTYRELGAHVRNFKPQLVHAHNTFPLVSPSAYWAAAASRLPVVQTLHNFRLMCLQAMFLRQNVVCEDCLGHAPWRGIARRCYRGSTTASAAAVAMLTVHRTLGSFKKKVTRYVALSQFARNKFIEGGLPAAQIVVKPNFADIPLPPAAQPRRGGLFVGRLAEEKGISLMLNALQRRPWVQVSVLGTGPLSGILRGHASIAMKGWQEQPCVYEHMHSASFLLLPSLCYESFPCAVVEAFACGLPVIAARLGAMAELIEDGRTGLLFESGSADDLAQKIAWADAHPVPMQQMGRQARLEYESKYTPEKNYAQLMSIYEDAIEHARCH